MEKINNISVYNIDNHIECLVRKVFKEKPNLTYPQYAELLGISVRTLDRYLEKFNMKIGKDATKEEKMIHKLKIRGYIISKA